MFHSGKKPDADQGKSRECCLFQADQEDRDSNGPKSVGKRIVKIV